MLEAGVKSVSFYVNGQWVKPVGRGTLPVNNPATGEVLAEVPLATPEDVDHAVQSAHAGYLKWRDVPVVDRVQVLYRYKALLETHAAELAEIDYEEWPAVVSFDEALAPGALGATRGEEFIRQQACQQR